MEHRAILASLGTVVQPPASVDTVEDQATRALVVPLELQDILVSLAVVSLAIVEDLVTVDRDSPGIVVHLAIVDHYQDLVATLDSAAWACPATVVSAEQVSLVTPDSLAWEVQVILVSVAREIQVILDFPVRA